MVKRSQQLSEGAAAVSSSIQSTATSGPKPTSHLTSSAMNNNNKPHANFKPQIQSTSTTNVKRPIPVQFQNLTRGPNGKFLPRSSSNNSNSTQGGATPPPNKQPINPPPTGFNYNNNDDGGHYQQSNNNNYGGGNNAPTLPSSYYPCGAPGGRMI